MDKSGTVGRLNYFAGLWHQTAASALPSVVTLTKGVFIGLLAASLSAGQAAAASAAERPDLRRHLLAYESIIAPSAVETPALAPQGPRRANFERERASLHARDVADWVVDSGNSAGLPFVIVDKMDARVFVFAADGRLRGAAPALLGSARGDDSAPGIGDREMSNIRPEDRTTPAGRFVSALGRNMHGKEILWIDYKDAIAMHAVITTKPAERRLERLATATPLDNRISYGCINVPAKFFESVVQPAFTGTNGIVYVLPETRSAQDVFGSYKVTEYARSGTTIEAMPGQATAGPAHR